MNDIALNLIVLRSSNIERAAEFYACLGLRFTRHHHGKGPEHFAAELAGVVFELYPLAVDGPSTRGTRVGFRVSSLDAAIAGLGDFADAVATPPHYTEWGRRAVVVDPDGHKVELIEAES